MEAAVCLIAIFKNSAYQNGFSIGAEAEAHIQRLIHPALVLGGDLPGPLPQAVFVQRADLLKQDDAVLGEARVGGPALSRPPAKGRRKKLLLCVPP